MVKKEPSQSRSRSIVRKPKKPKTPAELDVQRFKRTATAEEVKEYKEAKKKNRKAARRIIDVFKEMQLKSETCKSVASKESTTTDSQWEAGESIYSSGW